MDRQTAVILESIFGGIAVLFAILWMISFFPLLSSIISGGDPLTIVSALFGSIYFWLMLVFIIPASIFGEIKKNIDKRPVQKVIYVPQPQQQQQQQVIQVNVPPVPSPPVQYYTTAIPSLPPQPPPQVTHPEPPAKAIYCIRCGSQNMKFAKFCKVCGATIE